MKTLKHFSYILVAALGMMFGGCSNILDLESLTEPNNEDFFSNEQELLLALTGVYNTVYWVDGNNIPCPIMMDNGGTDNGVSRGISMGGFVELGAGSQSSSTSWFATNYEQFYKGIARANNLLNNMPRAREAMDENRYNQIRGEALSLRAYCYHFLTELYGDVPYTSQLATSPDEALIPRMPKEQVADSMLNDLQLAADFLPNTQSERGRFTKGAALALQARIALYNSRFDVAASAARAAIALEGEAGYSLYSNYEELFQPAGENAAEVMFVIPFKDGVRTQILTQLQGSRNVGGFGQLIPTQALVDSYEATDGLPIDESTVYDPKRPFENRDPRLQASIITPQSEWAGFIFESHPDSLTYRLVDGTVAGTNNDSRNISWPAAFCGYYWKKYTEEQAQRERRQWSDQDFILLRYAEVLLTYAEATIEAGMIDGTTLNAINRVRARAYGVEVGDTDKYPAITTTDQTALRRIIRRERLVEFANEGLRLFDIRRWRIAEKVMPQKIYGRLLDPSKATAAPDIDEDGLISYTGLESLYDFNPDSRFPNAQNRKFTNPRDYLLPIPQAEIDTYRASGMELGQNEGY